MSLFDGLATLTNDTFGAVVSVTPVAGEARTVHAVFREEPTTVLDAQGVEVPTVLITLRAPHALIEDLRRGSIVDPGKGQTYRVLAPMRTMNPADDAHLVLQLERAQCILIRRYATD